MADTTALTQAQLDIIEHSILRNPYIPAGITPTLKQAQLLTATEDEVLYGGSVRGGKSEGLLMMACQYKQQPDSHTLVVRRNRASLTNAGALIERSHDYLGGTDAKWNGSTFKWTFPNRSSITFGYLDDQKAVEQYLSAAYTDILFEEVTDITEALFAQLIARNSKRVDNPLPLRVVATCNPPESRQGEWIRDRFVRSMDAQGVAQANTFNVVDDETGTTVTRRMIPAGLIDNPHEDRVAYSRRLASVDRLTRARMLGSWTQAREGKMLEADAIELADGPQHGPHVVRVRAWDFAASKPTSKYPDPDFTVGALMSIDTQLGSMRIEDVIYLRDTPAAVKKRVIETAQHDGIETMVRWWQDPAQAGKSQSWDYATALARWDARGIPARTNKVTNFSPFAAAAGNGRVSCVQAEWTADYLGSLLSFPTKGVHDDDVDATSLAYAVLVRLDETLGNESRTVAPGESESDTWERDLRRARGLPPDDGAW